MKKKFLLGFGLLAMVLPWTVWAEEEGNLLHDLTISLSEEYSEGKVYNAEDFAEKVKSAVTVTFDGDLTVSPSDYEVTFKKDNAEATELKNVGTYTVIVTPLSTSAYRKQSPVQTTFTITQRKVTGKFTLADNVTKTYGEDDQSILENLITGFTPTEAEGFDGLAENDGNGDDAYKVLFPSLKVGRYQAEEGENAGTYKVIVEGNGSAETNYAFTLASGGGNYAEMTIEPLELTVTVDEQEYQGSAYTASALNYTIKAGETVINNENPLPFKDKLAVTLTADEDVTLKDVEEGGYTLNVKLVADDDNAEKQEEDKYYTNVNNYTLVTGQSVIENTANFTIKPATLTIKAKADEEAIWEQAFGSVTADADLTKTNFDIDGWKGDDNNVDAEDTPEKKLTLKWYNDEEEGAVKPSNAAAYPIKAYYDGEEVEDDNIGNYTLEYKDAEGKEVETAWNFTITGKGIADFYVAANNNVVIYQGKDYELVADETTGKTGVVTVTDNGITLIEGTDYTVARTSKPGEDGYIEAINAGSPVAVTITGIKNYSGTKNAELTIQKAPLTIALEEGVTSLGKTYGDATESDNLYGQYLDITGWKLEEKSTVGGNLKMVRHGHGDTTKDNECAGSYNIYLYNGEISEDTYLGQLGGGLKELANYYFETYEGGIKFVISPKPITYWIASAEKTYDATANLTKVKVTYATEGENGETGLITGDTFENIFGVFTNDLFTTEAGVAPTVALAEGEDNEGVNVGDYKLTVANSESVKANNYILTYSSKEDDNYEITPGTVTITVDPLTVDFGTAITEDMLAGWVAYKETQSPRTHTTISNTPNDGDDRAAIRSLITLEPKTANGASGTYEGGLVVKINTENVTPEVTTAGYADVQTLLANYGYGLVDEETEEATNFIINNGNLIIRNVTTPLVLDGSIVDVESEEEAEESENEDNWSVAKKLDKYNGAKVSSVTIKNLRNFVNAETTTFEENALIKANQWYTLVLPFDITVRELSNIFGYAVVNVPNTGNTDGQARFMLTLGTVKANTLMAFKVDEDIVWEANKTVTFGNDENPKTIVNATDEWAWATDGKNKFIGVYAKKNINKATEKFMLPTTGAFYPANHAVLQGHGYDVYPFNGYVEVGNANARIIMEEADGSTTAIDAVTGETIHNAAEGWYTIGGVKLNGEPTEKGIYINNGVKVVIK